MPVRLFMYLKKHTYKLPKVFIHVARDSVLLWPQYVMYLRFCRRWCTLDVNCAMWQTRTIGGDSVLPQRLSWTYHRVASLSWPHPWSRCSSCLEWSAVWCHRITIAVHLQRTTTLLFSQSFDSEWLAWHCHFYFCREVLLKFSDCMALS